MGNSELFKLTQLAEASYADFEKYENDPLKGLKEKDFSDTQAKDLLSHWSVASHQPNTSSGFSATLFKSKDDTSKYVLAIRGTEPTSFIKDWMLTDIADIVRDGLAMDQIVDMYNYWQQLKASAGTAYNVAVLETLTQETINYNLAKAGQFIPGANLSGDAYIAYLRSRTDIMIDEPSGRVRKIDLTHTSVQIYTDERRLGLDIDPASVTVVGHSLGGHLAAAFSRLFSGETTEALMINGAGFGDGLAAGAGGNGPTNVDHLFSMLGGATSFNSGKINNLVGSAGIDFTSQDTWLGLHQPGGKEHIQTESAGIKTAFGHGASQMTDSMAVYDLFFRLDNNLANQTLNYAMTWLDPIFKAGSANDNYTLEFLVNSIGGIFVSNYKSIDFGQKNNREILYSRIKQIVDVLPSTGSSLISLAEASAGSISALAKSNDANGIAYRYALKQLNPFVVLGNSYSRFNNHGELDLIDPVTKKGSLSDSWINDRTVMLEWVMKANTEQSDSNLRPLVVQDDNLSGDPWFYDDRITGTTMLVHPSGFYNSVNRNVVFGKDSADTINGELNTDRLYGGGGDDTISGEAGNDCIEGGTGNDTITGGKGNDILVGGADGNDFIYGSDRKDALFGGNTLTADNYAIISKRRLAA